MILDAFGNARWQYIHLPGESFEHIYNYIYRGNIPILLGTHFNIYIYVCISMFGYYIHLIGESFLYMYIDVLNISILLGNHVNIAG